MGRNSTGAITTKESPRIELSFLVKDGFIKKNCRTRGSLSWTNGSSILIESQYLEIDKWIRLVYTLTDRNGDEYNYDYKIYLDTVPSNLGKGDILYFLCPISGKRCKILYRAYGYHKWKSRETYNSRIYYPIQVSSKLGIANDRYWQLKREIDNIYRKKHLKLEYDGKPTRKAKYLEKLEAKRNFWDYARWQNKYLPLNFRKHFTGRTFDMEEALFCDF